MSGSQLVGNTAAGALLGGILGYGGGVFASENCDTGTCTTVSLTIQNTLLANNFAYEVRPGAINCGNPNLLWQSSSHSNVAILNP